MHFKIIGIVLTVLAFTGYGFMKASVFSKRIKLLRKVIRFLSFAKEQILFYRTELPSVLDIGLRTDEYKTAAELFVTASKSEVGERFCKELTVLDCQIIREFSVDLGMSGYDMQKERFEGLLNRMNLQVQEAVEDMRVKSRLYATLGVCSGVCFVIIVI